jgi:hypothetical protein
MRVASFSLHDEYLIIPQNRRQHNPLFVNISERIVKFAGLIPKKFTGFAQFVLFHGTYGEYYI